MFITGPEVIKTVTHEEVTKEDSAARWRTTPKSRRGALRRRERARPASSMRELSSYLPSNNIEDPPRPLRGRPDPEEEAERS